MADVSKHPPPDGDRAGRHGSHHLTVGDTVRGVEFASFNDASVKNKVQESVPVFFRVSNELFCFRR